MKTHAFLRRFLSSKRKPIIIIPIWILANVVVQVWAAYEALARVYRCIPLSGNDVLCPPPNDALASINGIAIISTSVVAMLMGYLWANYRKATLSLFLSDSASILLAMATLSSVSFTLPSWYMSTPQHFLQLSFAELSWTVLSGEVLGPLFIIGLCLLMVLTGFLCVTLGAKLAERTGESFRFDWRLSSIALLLFAIVVLWPLYAQSTVLNDSRVNYPIFTYDWSDGSLTIMVALVLIAVLLSIFATLRPAWTSTHARNLLLIISLGTILLALNSLNYTIYIPTTSYQGASFAILAGVVIPMVTILAGLFRKKPAPSVPFYGLRGRASEMK